MTETVNIKKYGVCMNKKFYNYLFHYGELCKNELIEYFKFLSDYIDKSSTHDTLLGEFISLFNLNKLDKIDEIDLTKYDTMDADSYNELKNELKTMNDISEKKIKELFHKYFRCFDVDKQVIDQIKQLNEKDVYHQAYFNKYFIIIDDRINIKKIEGGKLKLMENMDSSLVDKLTNAYMTGGSDELVDKFKSVVNKIISSNGDAYLITNEYTGIAEVNVTFNKIKFDGKTFTIDDLLKEMQDDTNPSNCYITSPTISCADIIQSIINKLKDSTPLAKNLTAITPITPDQIKKINPLLALFTLGAFEFKKKQIKNGVDQTVYVFPNVDENNFTKSLSSTNLKSYLQQLVNYINGNPSFLNTEYRDIFQEDLANPDFAANCGKMGLSILRVNKNPTKGWDIIRESNRRQVISISPFGPIFAGVNPIVPVQCGGDGNGKLFSDNVRNIVLEILQNAEINNVHIEENIKKKLLDMINDMSKLEENILNISISIQELTKKTSMTNKEIAINDLNEIKIQNKRLELEIKSYTNNLRKIEDYAMVILGN
jgi:hypothetical protein